MVRQQVTWVVMAVVVVCACTTQDNQERVPVPGYDALRRTTTPKTVNKAPTPPAPPSLSQELPDGQVAYFMAMQPGSVIADELREGDRVDIMALIRDEAREQYVSEVVLQNVALLRALREQGSPPPRTAVLALTLDEARKLEGVLEREGQLRVMIRAINDETIVASRRFDAAVFGDGSLRKLQERGAQLRRHVKLFERGPLARRLPRELRAVSLPLSLSEASRAEIVPGDRIAVLDGARVLLRGVEVVDTGLPIAGARVELGLALHPDEAAVLWLAAQRRPPSVVLSAPPAK